MFGRESLRVDVIRVGPPLLSLFKLSIKNPVLLSLSTFCTKDPRAN